MSKATTVWMEEETLRKLQDYAYTERITIREAVNQILMDFLRDKETLDRPERSRK
jgi:hypothetical protein